MRAPAEKRFWAKVRKGRGCWEFTGYRTAKGYGTFYFNGKTQLAHRASWEMANGRIPNGLHVLHRCDNPPCIRPEHLFL